MSARPARLDRGWMHDGMPGTPTQEEPRFWRLPGGLAILANILMSGGQRSRFPHVPGFLLINATRA
jgi:hypothetical protein